MMGDEKKQNPGAKKKAKYKVTTASCTLEIITAQAGDPYKAPRCFLNDEKVTNAIGFKAALEILGMSYLQAAKYFSISRSSICKLTQGVNPVPHYYLYKLKDDLNAKKGVMVYGSWEKAALNARENIIKEINKFKEL